MSDFEPDAAPEEEEDEEDTVVDEEEEEDPEPVRTSRRGRKPGKTPTKNSDKKKESKSRRSRDEEVQEQSDGETPFKQLRRPGPRGRPPRTTNYQFIDPRLKEIYLLSQPFVVAK